jgi:hypothetical protein
MSVWDDLAPVDRVAEGLWQTVNAIDGEGLAAHKAWLALPEADKEPWRAHATEAIQNWKANGFA